MPRRITQRWIGGSLIGLGLALGLVRSGLVLPTAPESPTAPAVGPAAATTGAATAAVRAVAELQQQRLALMHDVARAKWNAGRPALDPERERASLAALVQQGAALGLPADRIRRFFEAQFAAARLIQQADLDAWRAAGRGPFPDAPDLAADLRPRIDRLNTALLEALAALDRLDPPPGPRDWQAAAAVLEGRGLDAAVRGAALAPWPTTARDR